MIGCPLLGFISDRLGRRKPVILGGAAGLLAVLAWVLTDRRWLQWSLTIVALVVPPVVGVCRMYRGFHHLSDVVAGGLLGIVWLTAATRLFLLPALERRGGSYHVHGNAHRITVRTG